MAQTESNCLYQYYLTNHIHKFILQNDSKATVDDALVHMKNVLDQHNPEETLLLFIDARLAVPPLQYFFRKLRKLYGTYEQLPPIRAVYLYEESVVMSVLQLFFNALRMQASRRFIKNGTELEAQDWLLSTQESPKFSTVTH